MKPIAASILQRIHAGELEGVYASTAAIQKIIFWFFNRKLIAELIVAVNTLTHSKNLKWMGITTDVCLNATILTNECQLNPFDAYHAAPAIIRDKQIIITEHVYDRIKGLKRINPKSFIENL
ncbi:MAG: hypothetical protein ACTSVM_00395 [Candidatus Ranarchaeia archaeon]